MLRLCARYRLFAILMLIVRKVTRGLIVIVFCFVKHWPVGYYLGHTLCKPTSRMNYSWSTKWRGRKLSLFHVRT